MRHSANIMRCTDLLETLRRHHVIHTVHGFQQLSEFLFCICELETTPEEARPFQLRVVSI